jgi:hypothetical protein
VALTVMQREFTCKGRRENDHVERSRRYGLALSTIGEGGAVSVLVVVGSRRNDTSTTFRGLRGAGRVRMPMLALGFMDESAVVAANGVRDQREVQRAGKLRRHTRDRDDDGRKSRGGVA